VASIAQAVAASTSEVAVVSIAQAVAVSSEEVIPTSTRKRSKGKPSGQGHRDSNNAKRVALAKAVIGADRLVDGSAGGSVNGEVLDEPPFGSGDLCMSVGETSRWIELIEKRCNDYHFPEVELKHIITGRIGESFPIIRCIDNKDICDPNNWRACILKKIRTEQYELLDTDERD